ncbi:peptidase inhibitor family I36 protein [Streptomyces sp. NPDC127119]|uniref:peptidase inhibitor family I36 protein n=1 Tax=Streptomyces sp. NPDC127119 TaxID=3345370 RepID=UPI003636E37A
MTQARMAAYTAALMVASFGLMACGAEKSDRGADKPSKKSDLAALSGEQRTVSEQPIPLPAFEDNPNPQGEFKVEVCEHTGFERCTSVSVASSDSGGRNDKISSIRNDNNFSITFYSENDFAGASITIKPHESIDNLGTPHSPVELNDKISSWQPQVAGRATERAVVTVCTEPELRGECQDLPISKAGTDLNDKISSIQNLSDLDLVLYADKNYRGAAIKMPSRTYLPNLNPEGPNNGIDEKISSWQPEASDNVAPKYPN